MQALRSTARVRIGCLRDISPRPSIAAQFAGVVPATRRFSCGLTNKIMAVLCRILLTRRESRWTQAGPARLLDIVRAARMLPANSLPARSATGTISFL